jgi:hypothetical protein
LFYECKNEQNNRSWIVEWLKSGYEPWVTIPSVGVHNLVDFHLPSTITMSPYARWVVPSFKDILINSCDEYPDSSNRGNDKTWSTLIARVTKDITNIADKEWVSVPNDLEKVIYSSMVPSHANYRYPQCVCTWFGNYASGNSKEPRPGKLKSDTRGHPISSKAGMAKSVCAHAFADRISNKQIRLSDGGEKDIGKYWAALTTIFEGLT